MEQNQKAIRRMSSFSQDAYPSGGGLNARPLQYPRAPNYGYSTFAPTPLGQGLGGSGGGGANDGPGLNSGAASSTTAAAFPSLDNFSNLPHKTERGQRHQTLVHRRRYHQFRKSQKESRRTHQGHPRGERPELYQQSSLDVETKMELPSDIAEQQAAALNYEPELEVGFFQHCSSPQSPLQLGSFTLLPTCSVPTYPSGFAFLLSRFASSSASCTANSSPDSKEETTHKPILH